MAASSSCAAGALACNVMLRRPVFSPASTGVGVETVACAGNAVGERNHAEPVTGALCLDITARSVCSSGVPGGSRRSALNSPCDIWGINSVPRRGRISSHGRQEHREPPCRSPCPGCASAHVIGGRVLAIGPAIDGLRAVDERAEQPTLAAVRISSCPAAPEHAVADARPNPRLMGPRGLGFAMAASGIGRQRRVARAACGEHRYQGQSDQQRESSARTRHRERLVLEQLARDAGDEDHRREDGNRGERRRKDRRGDVGRAQAGGLAAVESGLVAAARCFRARPRRCRRACRPPSAMPPSDMMLSVMSKAYMSTKVPSTDTGIAMLLMSVARASRRNA
jgi:hypothetical protein